MTKDQDGGLRKRLASALGGVAPTLARALGGPLAGAAAGMVARAITGEDEPSETMVDAILAGDPSALAAVRMAEIDFRKAVLTTDLEARRIAAGDRADARARQIAVKDITPALLGFGVIGGFFLVLAMMLLRQLPVEAETEFSIMLGALATMTAAVVNYYFGSSAESAEKTRVIGALR